MPLCISIHIKREVTMNRRQKRNNDYWWKLQNASDSACATKLGQGMLVLMLLVAAYYWFWVY